MAVTSHLISVKTSPHNRHKQGELTLHRESVLKISWQKCLIMFQRAECNESSREFDLGNEKNILKWHNALSSASHCGLAQTWMNLPQTDLLSCRLQDRWLTVQYLLHWDHSMNQLVRPIEWFQCFFGHIHETQCSQLTEQMFAVTTRCDCVWQLRLISKLTRKSSFSYFSPGALLSLWTETLKSCQIFRSSWNVFNMFALEIWLCCHLGCLENVSPTRFRHLILIFLRTFLSHISFSVFMLIRICLS